MYNSLIHLHSYTQKPGKMFHCLHFPLTASLIQRRLLAFCQSYTACDMPLISSINKLIYTTITLVRMCVCVCV